jgi:hypothetical protein
LILGTWQNMLTGLFPIAPLATPSQQAPQEASHSLGKAHCSRFFCFFSLPVPSTWAYRIP